MTDVVDPQTRSRMMSEIRGKNTSPEVRLRRALHALGFRFRIHARELPGSPDIVLPRWNAVILVHGCFWHRHEGCRFTTTPATRPEFWAAKFRSNVERDARNLQELRRLGWRTAVVWECGLRQKGAPEPIGRIVADWIRAGADHLDVP